MFKKNLSFILILSLLVSACIITTSYAEPGPWFMSSDGVVEARVVSWEETNYPIYKLTLQFRLDQQKESKEYSFNYDLSSHVTQYASAHPAYNNRKVNFVCSTDFDYFKLIHGVNYKTALPCTVGTEKITTLANNHIDLSEIFPNDFINTDALLAAKCCNEIKKYLPYPSSFEITSDISMLTIPSLNLFYFSIPLTIRNNTGSINDFALVSYNHSDGCYIIYLYYARQYLNLTEGADITYSPAFMIDPTDKTGMETIPAYSVERLL